MNENSKISVIVPVYNAEQYLERCIDSIISQSYSNIEIILVDDGSTDSSGKMCDRYAEKDARIRVIHKCNGGQASARNEGLRVASGDFVGFVDNDDVIEPQMYEVLYENLRQHNVKVSGIIADWIYPCNVVSESEKFESRFYSSSELMINMLAKKNLISSSVWDKLFDKSLFDNIKFPDGCEYEDYWVIINILEQIDGIYIETKPLYHWYQYDTSQSKRGFHEKSYSYVLISKRIRDELKKNRYDTCIVDAATCFVLISYIKFFGKTFRTKGIKTEAPNINMAQIKRDLRNEINDAKNNIYVSNDIKLKCYLLSGCLCSIYKRIWIGKNEIKNVSK